MFHKFFKFKSIVSNIRVIVLQTLNFLIILFLTFFFYFALKNLNGVSL